MNTTRLFFVATLGSCLPAFHGYAGPAVHAEKASLPRFESGSLKDLGCSAIVDLISDNENRVPKSIKDWRELIQKNSGLIDAVHPVSFAQNKVDLDFPRFLMGSGRTPFFNGADSAALKEPWTQKVSDGQLFMGIVPDENDRARQHLEFVSWNAEKAGYDFGIIKDFNNPARRQLVTSGKEVDVCLTCHQNHGPIFLSRGWSGALGGGSTPGNRMDRIFFENAIHRSPEYYRQAAKKYGDGKIDDTAFRGIIKDETIRLPSGEDTGYSFRPDPASFDVVLRRANDRRRVYQLLTEKTPDEREKFFRETLAASIFGGEKGSSPSLDAISSEVAKRMKNPSHPSLYGDNLQIPTHPLLAEDPVSFIKKRAAGLKLGPEYSAARPGALLPSLARISTYGFSLDPTSMLNLVKNDGSAILEALKVDVPADRVSAVTEAAMKTRELAEILRKGIPQRETMLKALVNALKAEAAARGLKTPTLDKINYVPRPGACGHRWDGKRDAPVKAESVTSSCAGCHHNKTRNDLKFDASRPELWKDKFAKAKAEERGDLKALLDSSIDYLKEGTMPPSESKQGKAMTKGQRDELLKALKALKKEFDSGK